MREHASQASVTQPLGLTVLVVGDEARVRSATALLSSDIGPAQLQAIELAGLLMLHKPVQLEALLDLLQPARNPMTPQPARLACSTNLADHNV